MYWNDTHWILLFTYDYEQTLLFLWTYIFIYNFSLLPIFVVLFQLTNSSVKTINLFSSIGYNSTLTKFLMISLLSSAGIPPFLGFFSKIFIFILLSNSYVSIFFFIFFILLFTSLYFYLQTIRFLNTSNLENKNVIVTQTTHHPVAVFYCCFPNVFMLIFGFLFIDDLFVFIKWVLN